MAKRPFSIADLDNDPIVITTAIHPLMSGSLLEKRLKKEPVEESQSIWDVPQPLNTVDNIFRPNFNIGNKHLVRSVETVNLVVDCRFDPKSAMVGSASGIHPSEIAKSGCGDPGGRIPTSHGGTGTQYHIKTNTAVFVNSVSHATLAIMINNVVHVSRRARWETAAFGPSSFKRVIINMQPQKLVLRFPSPHDIQYRVINTAVGARRFPGVAFKVVKKKRMPDGNEVETVIPNGLTFMVVKGSYNVIVTGRPQSKKRLGTLLNMAFRNRTLRYLIAIGTELGE